jgi:RHS repeat-associated protein
LNGPGIDNHLRQTSATTGISYYLTDRVGSTAGLTDATGNLVEQTAYDSFGNSSGSSYTRYTYTGREFDTDTGLYYYRARCNNPQTGRFLSEDPTGFDGGANWYAYVDNNPVLFNDPSGLVKVHGDLSSFCNDCDTIDSDIARLEESIADRSSELSGRRRQGLKIDSGHTGRLAAERRTLQRYYKKREECQNEACPPKKVPVPLPVPTPNPTPRRRGLEDLRLRPGVLMPTPAQSAALASAAAAGNLAAMLLLLLILAAAP